MDLRKEKGSQLRKSSERYNPQSNNTRNTSPFTGQPEKRYGNTYAADRSPAVTDSRYAREHQNQSYGQRVASPQDQDSQARIEQRHEELKRQIALKEQQLAEMTNERDTAKRLRNKLGLDRNTGQNISGKSIVGEERSRSPMNNDPGMGGFRSTHLASQNFNNSSRQPLQFHPQRLNARGLTQTQSSQSPLRASNPDTAKSRSRERLGTNEDRPAPYNPRDPAQSYNEGNERSISPYGRSGSNPGFRNTGGLPPRQRSPLRGQPLASSSRDDFIKPMAVTNNFVSTNAESIPAQETLPTFKGPGARAQLYRDRIEAMTIDNSSLQRRLNQVGAELERISQEKEEALRQLQFHETDNGRLKAMIENPNNTDLTNQAMQEDLNRHKEENMRLQSKLKEEEIEQAATGNKLMDTNAARKNLELEGDALNSNLGQKLRLMDDLSKERVGVLSDLHQANNELERLNRQHLSMNHENIDMETHIQRLQSERHELLRNLEQLTITYDDCVRDITRERRNMDAQNDWQTKLIVTKIIFEHIQMFQKIRRQKALKELQEYVRFDKVCHDKLKAFSNTMYKLGQFKMKSALNQWYDSALKPLGTRHQNEDISIVLQANQLQARMFYAWKQYQQDKMDRYLFKTNAIEKIWFLMSRGAKKEMKRAMTIWKLRKQFNIHKYNKLRKAILNKQKDNCKKAFNRWQTQSSLMAHCVRVKILQIECSQKLFTSQMFNQMRFILRKEKQERIRTLNSVIKAWKDNIHYNRHLMQTNMAAIQFGQTNNRFILKNCFDGLRQHTEQMKYMTLDIAVKEDVDVAIRDTRQYNIDRERAFLTKNQLRAGFAVRAMLGKRLFTYFQKWKKESDHIRDLCKSKIYDRLLKISRNYQLMYFLRWRDQNNLAVMQKRSKVVYDIEQKNLIWHKDALKNEQNIQWREDQIRSLKRRLIDKTFRKLFFKRQMLAMKKWKRTCNLRGSQEQQAAFVIKKLRMRLLNDSFSRYIRFYRKSLQHDRNVNSAQHMRTTLEHKRMRNAYNSICFFINRQKTSQKYWKRIFGKIEGYMQAKALKTWLSNANLRHENQLINYQDRVTDEIAQRKQEIKRCEETDYTQQSYIDSQKKLRRNKAYKLLGNYFMRVATSQTCRGFRVWKDRIDQIIHKQGILIKTIQHWKKSQFLMLRSVLVKFMSQDRQREYWEAIKQTEIDQDMINIKRKQNVEVQDQLRSHEQMVIEETIHASAKRGEEYNKLMAIIERRQQDWVFGSRKRMIFKCWRHAVKQQKAFLLCVESVLKKSMMMKGFKHIEHKSKEILYSYKVQRVLNKIFAKQKINNTSTALTRWKLQVLFRVEQQKMIYYGKYTEKQREFEDWVSKCKDTNNARCLLFFAERNAKNVFQGWVNVVRQFQLEKQTEALFLEKKATLNRMAALKRWKMRSDKTIQCRFRTNVLIRSFQLKYRKSTFKALVNNYRNMKKLTSGLSNLEKMMRDKIYGNSFKTVRSFAVSKALVFSNCKAKGAEDLYNLVKQQYNKRIRTEFLRYKRKCMTDTQKREKLRAMLGHQGSERIRNAFQVWKDEHDRQELKQEMTECGPERAAYWTAMKEIDNLKDFMREEHYTEQEIKLKCKEWFNKNQMLLNKYISRMRMRQHPNKKLIPKVWNRWRQYVGMRKLIRYQMNYMENQTHNVKADLQRAFRKWKNGPEQLASELWKLPYNHLQTIGINTTKMVGDCSDTLAENQSIQNHLLIQRDEFLNYYVKSQILAMALIKDRSQYAKMQAISRWLWRRRLMNKADLDKAIRDAAYMQANLEAKQSYFSENNEHLTNENGELGQFTDDGTVIRKNMERLKEERDKLAKSMQDSEQDYQDLLAENERLKRLVEEAEARAKTNKNKKFQKTFKIQVETKAQAPEEETEAQRQKRERFEKLAKVQAAKGPSIRS